MTSHNLNNGRVDFIETGKIGTPEKAPKDNYDDVYKKEIRKGIFIDIYDILDLYEVTCPAACNAIKKLMAAGKRGAKSEMKDRQEALKCVYRSIELNQERDTRNGE